jgi:hypothetical protein
MRTHLAHRLAVARASRCAQFVCFALALATSACSRRSSERGAPSAKGTPSSAPSVPASEPARATLPLESKPLPAPVTPNVPPQLVACGERDFYRITRSSLQVFEIAQELPPPHIRGNRVARQTAEVAVGEPSNVFSPASKSVLVIAKAGVLGYELDQKRAQHYAPIQASAPLVAWADPLRANSIRVRAAGDEKLREFSLARLPNADGGLPPAPAQAARHVEDLPGFDARLFTVLADGTPLYSTPKGLARRGQESTPIPSSQPSAPVAILFGDSSPDRHWTADASGKLALWDAKQGGTPIFTSSVPGVVIDAVQEGERVAVLSMDLDAQGYRPTVTIFSNGKEQGRLSVGASVGARGQPQLDLCLIAGRPWVVVGGTRWMQLLDWESRRLLAEW